MSRRRRSAWVLVGFFLVLIPSGIWFTQTWFPHWWDQEVDNPAELARLSSAELATAKNTTVENASDLPWPQWLGPARNGSVESSPLRTDWATRPPKTLWRTPVGGGHASCIFVRGHLITLDYLAASPERPSPHERLLVLDATTGDIIRQVAYPVDYSGLDRTYANGPRVTPAYVAGCIWAVSADGRVRAWRVWQGEQLEPQPELFHESNWPAPRWGFARSPVVSGDRVFIQTGTREAMLTAFHATTGERLWQAAGDPEGYSSPAVGRLGEVEQVVAVGGSTVQGFRLSDGTPLWSLPWATQFQGNIATPLLVGDYVFISSAYAKGCSLIRLESTGATTCRAQTVYFRSGKVMQNHHSNAIYHDGFLYGYDADNLRCVNLRLGQAVPDWLGRDAANRVLTKGCLIRIGSQLLIQTQSGHLVLAEANPEEFVGQAELKDVLQGPRAWALPIFVNGVVYLRDDTQVLALDVR